MNLKEKFGVDHNTEHDKKYRTIVSALGYNRVRELLPWNDEELKAAYSKDSAFNSIPIKEWDCIAGFRCVVNQRTGTEDIRHFLSPLKNMLYEIGVDTYSPAELVCILKQCAKMCVLGLN